MELEPLATCDVYVRGGATFRESLFNSVNILLGVGLLSVPFALREGGWAALVVLALLGVTTNYTGKLIVQCQEEVYERGGNVCTPLATYEDIGEAAFGELGRQLITWVLYTELVGTCGLFFILEGDHLSALLNSGPESRVALMAASALVMVPTTYLRDMSGLSKVGLLGAVSSIGMLGLVGFTFFASGGMAAAAPETLSPDSLVHLSTLPLTFGLLAFVFAGHAVFPGIYASMDEPERYPEMLNITYFVVGLCCLSVGVFGYLLYGDNVAQEVTLNLPAGLTSTMALLLIVINPVAKFGLTMDPVARGMEEALDLKGEESYALSIVGRTGLGMSALVLATSVPNFALFMALVGSFLTLAVSVIFPSLCYLEIFKDKLSDQERYINYLVVVLGIGCVFSGTSAALMGLSSL